MKNVLLIFLLIINILTLSAEDEIVVEVTTHPVPPVINNPWTLSLIVDYPFPDDVSVIEPAFAAAFFLERIIKYTRTLDTKVKTVFEYNFIPLGSGSFKIESFTVICPDGISKTNPFNLDILPVNEKRTLPVIRLFWEINTKQTSSLSLADSFQMTAGEHALLVLRVSSRNPPLLPEYPPQEYFMPAVPQGAILALSPLSTEERTEGIMLKLLLIPLKGNFRLVAGTLQHENFIFEIPPLFIRIDESAEKTGEAAHITDMEKARSLKTVVQENKQYSELPANVTIQRITAYNTSRKFYLVLFYSVIILVIFIPVVCFLFFKNEKK
jgi:hypothetical protein